jgi:aspartyl-tRNA(Asn)/glutamyl-tRNA(Gln) amidotransferase subunit A
MISTDIYAQLSEVLEKEKDSIGRTLAAVLEETRNMTVVELTAIQQLRAELNQQLEKLFDEFDLLVTPTTPTVAFAAEGPPPSRIDGQSIPLLGAVAFTYPFNFSGHPAASVPAGLTTNKLPVGLQIIAPRHQDHLVLQAAHAYERIRPWDNPLPGLSY